MAYQDCALGSRGRTLTGEIFNWLKVNLGKNNRLTG